MLGSIEILMIALLTLALVGFCLRSAIGRRADDGSRMVWIVLLAVGLVVWPIGWVTSIAYLVDSRSRRRTA